MSTPRSTAAAAKTPTTAPTAAPAAALTLESTTDDIAQLERLIEDLGSVDGWTARLERVAVRGVPHELCGYLRTIPFTADLLDDVREEHGGGRFRARICDADSKYKRSITFTIAGAPRASRESDPPAAVGGDRPSGASRWETAVFPILVQVGTALAAGITQRLLEKPQLDPLVLELLKRERGAGDGADPVELNRLVLDAEERGERRGRELGQLVAIARRGGSGRGGDGGVVSAIREAAPLVSRFLDRADQDRTQERSGAVPPGNLPASPRAAASVLPPRSPAAAALASNTATPPVDMPRNANADAVPAWLRPFIHFKPFVIQMADAGHDPSAIAAMVVNNADDDTWNAIIAAEESGQLAQDLFAAMPELQKSAKRHAFADALLAELRDALLEPVDEAEELPDAGDAPDADDVGDDVDVDEDRDEDERDV